MKSVARISVGSLNSPTAQLQSYRCLEDGCGQTEPAGKFNLMEEQSSSNLIKSLIISDLRVNGCFIFTRRQKNKWCRLVTNHYNT